MKDDYDVVLIDTASSFNLFAQIALIACDYLIIPSDLKPLANKGLRNIKNLIEEIDKIRVCLDRHSIKVLGVLPSKILTNTNCINATLPKMEMSLNERFGFVIDEAFIEEKVHKKLVEDCYGFSVFETTISLREDLSQAIENYTFDGDSPIHDPKSIFDFKPDSISAAEFEDLANEVLEKIGVHS